jgi:hypothetical protein
MKKIYIFLEFILVLFFVNNCEIALAVPIYTDYFYGIERATLQDIAVEPLMGKNAWTQSTIASKNENSASIGVFYNWHVAYNGNLYPVGCAPLSVAQILRFYEHPQTPPMAYGRSLVSEDFYISLQGQYHEEKIMGGSGANGNYDWGVMEINPLAENFQVLSKDSPNLSSWMLSDPNTYEAKVRHEIASLLHDVGALMHTEYSYNGSGTYVDPFFRMAYPAIALNNFLGYPSAVYYPFLSNKMMQDVIKTNLDYGIPVIMYILVGRIAQGIDADIREWHSVIIDGYGYRELGSRENKTAYYHINFGYGESDYSDLWYDLSNFPILFDTKQGLYLDSPMVPILEGMLSLVFNIIPNQKDIEIYSGNMSRV